MKKKIGQGNERITCLGKMKTRKDDLKIEALGHLDELNCLIGLTRSFLKKQFEKIDKILEEIQSNIFLIGSEIAVGSKKLKVKEVKKIEKIIKEYDKRLPTIKKFVYPIGVKESCLLHLCRSFCRRVERIFVKLDKKIKLNPVILAYLNRLSDLFFVLARYVNFKNKQKEKYWN
jgi:cob(I)alamin adenosyltransferase